MLQAAIIVRKKEVAAESLRAVREALEKCEREAEERREVVKQSDGEDVLKGDEVDTTGAPFTHYTDEGAGTHYTDITGLLRSLSNTQCHSSKICYWQIEEQEKASRSTQDFEICYAIEYIMQFLFVDILICL